MDVSNEILDAIPHRPPFLFVDRTVECGDSRIVTEKYISDEEPFFKGHYPGNPIMPGVLLSECVFQAGAILISKQLQSQGGLTDGVPVITRVQNIRFKNPVRPNSLLKVTAELTEQLQNAYYLKGRVHVEKKLILSVEFTCALVSYPAEESHGFSKR